MKILGIESSCDDSSVALVSASCGVEWHWIHTHKEPKTFGGVVPELASRRHQSAFKDFLEEMLLEQFQRLKDADAIAYTAGPGLFGSLWVGASFAQALSWAHGLELYPIDHLAGHIFSPFIGQPLAQIPFPFVALLASGGHSQLWLVHSPLEMILLGTTRDDAAGEALDKAARYVGLGYPGGPHISKCAEGYEHSQFSFPITDFGEGNFDFSFSGLKSSFFRAVSMLSKEALKECRDELLAGFEIAVVDNLLKQLEKVLKNNRIYNIALSGGVSANSRLRRAIQRLAIQYGCQIFIPELKYTGDNAAMIAYCALLQCTVGARAIDPIVAPLKLYASKKLKNR